MFINSDNQRDELYREYGFRWHDENGNQNDILNSEYAVGRISAQAFRDRSRALELICARSFIMTPEIRQAWEAFQAPARVDPIPEDIPELIQLLEAWEREVHERVSHGNDPLLSVEVQWRGDRFSVSSETEMGLSGSQFHLRDLADIDERFRPFFERALAAGKCPHL